MGSPVPVPSRPGPAATSLARDEARLYLEWVRGAAGRFSPSGPREPAVALASTAATGAPRNETSIPRVPARAAPVADSGDPPEAEAPPPPVAVPGAATSAATAASEGTPDALDLLRADATACRRCPLCETRTTVVFGEGSRHPRLMVVGEAPGADEDASGRPFVGRAGQLLTRMLAAIGLARDDVYIANVLKCRPPGNRPPQPDEVAACRPYLREQMRLLAPGLVLVLGNHAARAVLGVDGGISRIRGRVTTTPEGVPVLPTYHPAYLLRTPEAKREAWIDLQTAAKTLGLPLPPRP